MKKFIILLICIFLIGILAFFIPNIISSCKNKKNTVLLNNHMQKIKEISSEMEKDLIEDYKANETEIYDENQMYFLNIEILSNYLSLQQIENVKYKVQSYIHKYIDSSILDCTLEKESLSCDNNTIHFNLLINNVKGFEVDIMLNETNQITDISILHNS